MTDTRPEKALTLGQYLREARKERQVSLEDIAKVTRVGIRYLAALEEESFDTLPADVYVRGYLRAYARELKLDVEDVMNRYAAARPTLSQAPVLRLANDTAPEAAARPKTSLAVASDPAMAQPPVLASRVAPQPGRPSGARSARPPRRLSLALAIVLLLVAAVTISIIYYVNQPNDRGTDPRGPTTTETATFDVTG